MPAYMHFSRQSEYAADVYKAFQMILEHKYSILNITTNSPELFGNLIGILQKGNPGKGTQIRGKEENQKGSKIRCKGTEIREYTETQNKAQAMKCWFSKLQT